MDLLTERDKSGLHSNEMMDILAHIFGEHPSAGGTQGIKCWLDALDWFQTPLGELEMADIPNIRDLHSTAVEVMNVRRFPFRARAAARRHLCDETCDSPPLPPRCAHPPPPSRTRASDWARRIGPSRRCAPSRPVPPFPAGRSATGGAVDAAARRSGCGADRAVALCACAARALHSLHTHASPPAFGFLLTLSLLVAPHPPEMVPDVY